MNVLITSGGTSEPIDKVRGITNTGTGRLGSLIAQEFSLYPETESIYYICSENALIPDCDKLSVRKIKSAQQLSDQITELLKSTHIDIIIHAMAVSDYSVESTFTAKMLAKALNDASSDYGRDMRFVVAEALDNIPSLNVQSDKISSELDDLLILLKPAPKIIACLREQAPDAIIVGFKLLSGVSREELLGTAHRLLIRNGCDYVLANDGETIQGDQHTGYLIDREMHTETFATKQEIARGIANTVMLKVTGK